MLKEGGFGSPPDFVLKFHHEIPNVLKFRVQTFRVRLIILSRIKNCYEHYKLNS